MTTPMGKTKIEDQQELSQLFFTKPAVKTARIASAVEKPPLF